MNRGYTRVKGKPWARLTVTHEGLVRTVLHMGGQLWQDGNHGWRLRAKGQKRTGAHLVRGAVVLNLQIKGQITEQHGRTFYYRLTATGNNFQEREYIKLIQAYDALLQET